MRYVWIASNNATGVSSHQTGCLTFVREAVPPRVDFPISSPVRYAARQTARLWRADPICVKDTKPRPSCATLSSHRGTRYPMMRPCATRHFRRETSGYIEEVNAACPCLGSGDEVAELKWRLMMRELVSKDTPYVSIDSQLLRFVSVIVQGKG